MRVIEEFAVSKSPTEVFDFIAVNYFENHQKFDPEIFGMINHTNGPVAKGTKGSEIRKFAGRKVNLDFEVTSFDSPKFFAFANTSGPFHLERSYNLEPTPDGVKVVFVFDIRPKNLPVNLIFPLMSKKFQKSVADNVKTLSKLLK